MHKKNTEPMSQDELEDVKMIRLAFFVFMPITGLVMGIVLGILLNI